MLRKSRDNLKVKQLSADEAVKLIKDKDTVVICGAGGGIVEPTSLIEALSKRYKESSEPKDLTLVVSSGPGDRDNRGISPLAQSGLVRRAIQGHWGQSPRLADMVDRNEIEGYNYPIGVMCQLFRTAAAGQPGLITHVGLGTFIDPRQKGGKLNEKTTEELIKLINIEGKDYLFYPSIFADVAIIRGTTADSNGNISMEDEICFMDVLATAQAVHNNGGIVICQVQKVVKANTLHPKTVKVPGYLVDAIVVEPNQPQLYDAPINRFMSGDFVLDSDEVIPMELNHRKIVARRALLEAKPGYVGNLGVGIADGIGVVAREEGVEDEFVLTVEHGESGGIPAQGIFIGAGYNIQSIIDMPSQFDFYDGGGLDIAFLSFAEVDRYGNVNVHKFNEKVMGTGGFINISQNTKKVIFCGTLTAGGFKAEIIDGTISIKQEGKFKKFVDKITEITFNGKDAILRDQEILYVTERAVFKLVNDGLELIEIAQGIDIEKDIIELMGFKPKVSKELKFMDKRIFLERKMGIKENF